MRTSGSRVPSWRTGPVVSAAALSVASGMAVFGVTVLIGDVAEVFGRPQATFVDVGLPVTTIGVALALRAGSLASLPVAALADRVRRRRLLLSAGAARGSPSRRWRRSRPADGGGGVQRRRPWP